MTQDSMMETVDAAETDHQVPMDVPTPSRRRTMAVGEMEALLARHRSGAKDLLREERAVPRLNGDHVRRRQSLTGLRQLLLEAAAKESTSSDLNDWETPRLDIEGFVVDYFTFRAIQDGLEWYEAPVLPYGTQPEHEMMRSMGTIFEQRNKREIEMFADQLLSSPRISFSVYQEVVQMVGWSASDSCPMTYGRLIGLIAFGGLVATKMLESADLRDQVRNLALYTSLFIKSRVKASWKEHERNWAGFMQLGSTMREKAEGSDRRRRRRLSLLGIGAAAAVVGAVVGGRIIFGQGFTK